MHKSDDIRKTYSLYALAKGIRAALQEKFAERTVWVKAEIAEIGFARSGHCYLDLVDLKDDRVRAKVRAVIWRSALPLIRDELGADFANILKKGAEVVLSVKVGYHLEHGLSITVLQVDKAWSLGEMERRKQETLDRLRKESLLDRNAALQLPVVLQRIALIGSPDTSGFRDFLLQLLRNEYGYKFEVRIFASSVQGEKAEEELIRRLDDISKLCRPAVSETAETSTKTADIALQGLNLAAEPAGPLLSPSPFDVVVIIRGGGSKLDLEAFNNYNLARRIALHPLPVMTGIGHETDLSVCDVVAHTHLKTPTAAAAFIVDRTMEFEAGVSESFRSIEKRCRQILDVLNGKLETMTESFRLRSIRFTENRRGKLHKTANRLTRCSREILSLERKNALENAKVLEANSKSQIIFQQNRLQESSRQRFAMVRRLLSIEIPQTHEGQLRRLINIAPLSLKQQFSLLEQKGRTLRLVHPQKQLRRGYAIVRKNGNVLMPGSNVAEGDVIEAELSDKKIESTVQKVQPK